MKKKATGRVILSLTAAILLAAAPCGAADMEAREGSGAAAEELPPDSKGATEFTRQKNESVYSQLDFADRQETEFAQRGRIASPEKLEIKDAYGNIVWSQKAYSFLEDATESPDTVNPSLWENAKNNHAYGLFEVEKGIYQVRGYDMANLTLVAGDTGWIVLDTTMRWASNVRGQLSILSNNISERNQSKQSLSRIPILTISAVSGLS